jgi:predicted dinucleotide-binding enzyme
VTVVDRDPKEAGRLAEELRAGARGGATVEAAEPSAGVRDEVVILAVYYPSTLEAARELGEELEGKVVVDISNPVNRTFDGLATEAGTSAAEELAQAVPADARVVKAFNTTFAGTLVEGEVAGQTLDVFIPETTRDPRRRWRSSRATEACVRSTSVRWSGRDTGRGSGSCT